MGPAASVEITRLLRAWQDGDQSAFDRLTPLVYGELHCMARRCMHGKSPGYSLQPTALVNEAYLHLVDIDGAPWQGRAHFFAVSAQIMRGILVDIARARGAEKRGGG
jgi:RNA polymerase sigma-70 factor (ECF subfamily)